MLKISITGGISSGKTTVTEYLSRNKNVFIFNADKESKRHLKNSISIQKKLIHIFSDKIIKNKKIDFNLLAKEAFSNSTNHKILNGILWPEVYILINNAFEYAKKNNYKLFIVDAALIFEANFSSFFDKNILLITNKDKRIKRAIKRSNIPLESIQNRMRLQMSDNKKKKLSDIIIHNNDDIKSLYKKIDKLYEKLILL
ncbi:MAG: dephospho-CoA kinase [Candidatus Marinimicrobia bacterium]|nr:dephospho-CoA kinase [Candidatus Neomarinimicrobiota bacterium]|tara:strand:+ start:1916 stop:2512 length:597 start_codon:yes stop_codon:yes gene_type:complete